MKKQAKRGLLLCIFLVMFLALAVNVNAAWTEKYCNSVTSCVEILRSSACHYGGCIIYLTEDLPGGWNIGERIYARNIIFDCQGHTVKEAGRNIFYLRGTRDFTIRNCKIRPKYGGSGWGIDVANNVDHDTDLTIENTDIAGLYKGILYECNTCRADKYYRYSTLTIRNSLIESNKNEGIHLRGHSRLVLKMYDSVVTGNSYDGNDGGIHVDKHGGSEKGPKAYFTRSTLCGNDYPDIKAHESPGGDCYETHYLGTIDKDSGYSGCQSDNCPSWLDNSLCKDSSNKCSRYGFKWPQTSPPTTPYHLEFCPMVASQCIGKSTSHTFCRGSTHLESCEGCGGYKFRNLYGEPGFLCPDYCTTNHGRGICCVSLKQTGCSYTEDCCDYQSTGAICERGRCCYSEEHECSENAECCGSMECVEGQCYVPPCEFETDETVTFTTDCTGGICEPGNKITLENAKFTGICNNVNTLTIETASGTECLFNIVFSGSVDSGNFNTEPYTISYVPPECIGETVTAFHAAAYNSEDPGNSITDTYNVLGDFTFSQNINPIEDIELFPESLEVIKTTFFEFRTTVVYNDGSTDDITTNLLTFYIAEDVSGGPNVLKQDSQEAWKFEANEKGTATVTVKFPYESGNPWPLFDDDSSIEVFEGTPDCNIFNHEVFVTAEDCINGEPGCEISEKINTRFRVKRKCFENHGLDKIKIRTIENEFFGCSYDFEESIDIDDDCIGPPYPETWQTCIIEHEIDSIPIECLGEEVFAYYLGLYHSGGVDELLNYEYDPEPNGFGAFNFWGPTCEITDADMTAYCINGEEGDGTEHRCGDEFPDRILLGAEFNDQCNAAEIEITLNSGCDYTMRVPCSASGCEEFHELIGVPSGCEDAFVKANKVELFNSQGESIATLNLDGSDSFYFADSANAIIFEDLILIPTILETSVGKYISYFSFAKFTKQGNLWWEDVSIDPLTKYTLPTNLQQEEPKNNFRAIEAGTDLVFSSTYPEGYSMAITKTSSLTIYEQDRCEIFDAKAAAKCGDNGCENNGGDYIDIYAIVDSDCVDTWQLDKIKMIALGDGCEVNMPLNEINCEQIGSNYNCSGSWTVDAPVECLGVVDIRDGAHVTTKYVFLYDPGNDYLGSSFGNFGGFSFWPIIDRVKAVINMPENNEILETKTVTFNASRSYYIDEHSQHIYCPDVDLDFTWQIDGQTFQGTNCEKKFVYHQYSQPKNNYQVTLEAEFNQYEDEVTHNFKIYYCSCYPQGNDLFFIGDCKTCEDSQRYECIEEGCNPQTGTCSAVKDCIACPGCPSPLHCSNSGICEASATAGECEDCDELVDCHLKTGCYWDIPSIYWDILPPSCKHCDDESTAFPEYGSVSHCSNYNEEVCELDRCGVGNEEHGDCPSGYSCSNYECTWDSSSTECQLAYDKTPEGQGSQQQCHESRTYDMSNCDSTGYMTVTIETECCGQVGSGNGETCTWDMSKEQISDVTTTETQVCGVITRALPGFGWLNFIIVIFLISVYYVIYVMIISKKK